MSGLTPEQRELAELLFSLPEAGGFALAGGSALVALRIVERTTRDLDAFVAARAGSNPGSVEPLLDAAHEAFLRAGWALEVVRRHPTLCRMIATKGAQAVEVDLAVDSPPLLALEMVDGLPVLSPLDLAARKILATLDRAEARDFTDLWSLSQVLGRRACVEAAQSLDPGVDASAIVVAFGHIDRLMDGEFPVRPGEVKSVRAWFTAWQRALGGE